VDELSESGQKGDASEEQAWLEREEAAKAKALEAEKEKERAAAERLGKDGKGPKGQEKEELSRQKELPAVETASSGQNPGSIAGQAAPRQPGPPPATSSNQQPGQADEAKALEAEKEKAQAGRSKQEFDAEHARRKGKLAEVFKAFDLDAQGTIEASELLTLGRARREAGHKTSEWTEKKNNEMLARAEKDKGGALCEKQFVDHFVDVCERERDSPKEFDTRIQEYLEAARRARQGKTGKPAANVQKPPPSQVQLDAARAAQSQELEAAKAAQREAEAKLLRLQGALGWRSRIWRYSVSTMVVMAAAMAVQQYSIKILS